MGKVCPEDTNAKLEFLSEKERSDSSVLWMVMLFEMLENQPSTYEALNEQRQKFLNTDELPRHGDKFAAVRMYVSAWGAMCQDLKLGGHPRGKDGCQSKKEFHRICWKKKDRSTSQSGSRLMWIDNDLAERLFQNTKRSQKKFQAPMKTINNQPSFYEPPKKKRKLAVSYTNDYINSTLNVPVTQPVIPTIPSVPSAPLAPIQIPLSVPMSIPTIGLMADIDRGDSDALFAHSLDVSTNDMLAAEQSTFDFDLDFVFKSLAAPSPPQVPGIVSGVDSSFELQKFQYLEDAFQFDPTVDFLFK